MLDQDYALYPLKLVNELFMQGNRKKARAFMEYWHDMHVIEIAQDEYLYAKEWGLSVEEAADWIDDFNNEIDRFAREWRERSEKHFQKCIELEEQENGESWNL